ncbi:nucleotidyltransferase domain-containing protein [Spirosoma knui]
MINATLANELPIVTRILKENGVERAYAFGSVCTDQFNENSDIDILIAFDDTLDPVHYGDNYFKIASALEAVLKRPVELVTERSLQNPYFIASLNKTKTAIYE